MKYAFIDYENLNSLDNLNLGHYQKIFVFIGINQHHLKLSEKFNDELSITLITVQSAGKNNLDFHISYYLGKIDQQADKDIEFHLFSKDRGFEGICQFISSQKQGRVCQLISSLDSSMQKSPPATSLANNTKNEMHSTFLSYINFLCALKAERRPQKITALQKDFMSRNLKKKLTLNHPFVLELIPYLKEEKILKTENNKIIYLK